MAPRRTPSGQRPGRARPRRPAGAATRSHGRSDDRPAARRTRVSHGTAKRIRAPRPRGRFTGRAAILALVLSALVLAYAYPVRTYLTQRAQIERLTESQRDQVKRIEALEEELDKWQDPEYVRAQARSRLYYIRPDEVPYVVVDLGPDRASEDPAARHGGKGGAWHERMWGSIAAADRAGR
ncbi:MAG TPA: septum formation initiator family protein [Micromonosporaceae bacterium]